MASGTTDEEVGGVAVADKAGAHHKGGEVADSERVGGGVGAPIELFILPIV